MTQNRTRIKSNDPNDSGFEEIPTEKNTETNTEPSVKEPTKANPINKRKERPIFEWLFFIKLLYYFILVSQARCQYKIISLL